MASFYRCYNCVVSHCFGLLSLTTHAGGLGFCQCVGPLSFQSHLIGFEVFNLFSCPFLVPVVSCDLSRSTFRTASPHYPAVLSLLVTSLPSTAVFSPPLLFWRLYKCNGLVEKKKANSSWFYWLFLPAWLKVQGTEIDWPALSERIMTLQTHSGENKVLCEILYFGSQGTLLLVLSSCSLNLPLNQGEHGTWSCFSEHKKTSTAPQQHPPNF